MGSSVTGVVDTPKNYIEGYGYHHVALLRDLSPGATYQYTVSCNGHTATRSFEVAPDGLTSYTALVLADMGYGSKGNAEQSRRMMEELKGPTRITSVDGDSRWTLELLHHPPTLFRVPLAAIAHVRQDEGCVRRQAVRGDLEGSGGSVAITRDGVLVGGAGAEVAKKGHVVVAVTLDVVLGRVHNASHTRPH